MNLVITNIIQNIAPNTRIIRWDLLGSQVPLIIEKTAPIIFTVYSSQDENTWTQVAQVNNTFQATDTTVYKLGSFDPLWYKVKMTAGSFELESQPKSISEHYLGKFRSYRIHKAINYKFRKYGTQNADPVILYRRRRFGNKCPVCAEPLANMPQKSFDSTCFGTGIEGGYFKIDDGNTYLLPQPMDSSEPVTEIGRLAIQNAQAILFSEEDIFPNDLIKLGSSGEIYEIVAMKQTVFAGVMMPVYIVQLVLKPRGHVVYNMV